MDSERESDLQLARRLAEGELPALEELYDRHGAAVFRLCRQILRQRADAEDATQEVFLKAFERAGQFQGRARLSSWLYRMAVNHCLRRLERERVRAAVAIEEDSACSGLDPSTTAAAREARQRLEAAMGRLGVEHRIVLHLREIEGASYEEIARALELPKGTVMSRLHRARTRLCELLGLSESRQASEDVIRNHFLRAVL